MPRGSRHLLIAIWLAVHGAVSACGPGAHLLAASLASDGVRGDLAVHTVHHCPICEWSDLGGLPVLPSQVASAAVPVRLVPVVRPTATFGQTYGPSRPRAPPQSV